MADGCIRSVRNERRQPEGVATRFLVRGAKLCVGDVRASSGGLRGLDREDLGLEIGLFRIYSMDRSDIM